MFLKLFILSAVIVLGFSEKMRYDDYAINKVYPQNSEDLQYLEYLKKKNDGLYFWKHAASEGDYSSIAASPENRRSFERKLAKRSIPSDLTLDNIQEAFEAQLYNRIKRDVTKGLHWTNYQTIDEIYEWFEHLANKYSDIVSLITVGQSFEGRNITGIKISRGSSRRNFILEGGQVGADWLSPTVLTYIVDQLVKGDNSDAKAATKDFTWHIFPITNPDGFQFSQDSVRLWTKNRRPTLSGHIGVDLTKNWNSQWGIFGGSFDHSASNYVGLGPFSEVETRALSRYIESIGPATTGFLSFRSFGQRLLIPFAHTTSPMYNYNEMVLIGRRAMGSLAVKYGTQYLVGTSAQVSDGATGGVADWVKHRFNPPIVATYLLRDDGRNWGYTLPVSQIKPSCEETFDSLLAILREAKNINVI